MSDEDKEVMIDVIKVWKKNNIFIHMIIAVIKQIFNCDIDEDYINSIE